MSNNKYSLKYLPSFYTELNEIINYIANKLKNVESARNLVNDIESSIERRKNNPRAFEVYKADNKYSWYRVYVKNFTVFYVVKNNIMIVAHIFYSRRDIDKLI